MSNTYFVVIGFVCLRFVSNMYPTLPVSLDCHFLIAPSVFSNVYLYIYVMSKLRTVFASSPNMILLLDTNGK